MAFALLSLVLGVAVSPAPTFKLFINENNVYARAVLHGDNQAVKYLGDHPDVEGCEAACTNYTSLSRNNTVIYSFTWHSPNFPVAAWRTGCYASVDTTWELHSDSAVVTGTVDWAPPKPSPPSPPPASGCTRASDCSYNGVCNNAGTTVSNSRTCACDRAWTGDACETLTLLPTNAELGYHAVVAGERRHWLVCSSRNRATVQQPRRSTSPPLRAGNPFGLVLYTLPGGAFLC